MGTFNMYIFYKRMFIIRSFEQFALALICYLRQT